jgi:hypothetical protein
VQSHPGGLHEVRAWQTGGVHVRTLTSSGSGLELLLGRRILIQHCKSLVNGGFQDADLTRFGQSRKLPIVSSLPQCSRSQSKLESELLAIKEDYE